MPFFLPRRLIEYEYFSGEPDPDYEELTPKEKAFIYKAWEEKIVSDSYYIYNAAFTATYNVNRGKNKKALKLWRKAKVRKADMEIIQDNLKIIREVEQKEGTSWIEKIYRANGMKFLRKGG